MDLQKHYDSYIESLRKDALEHYLQYAKDSPTKHPAQWPTIFDYISEQIPIIKGAIANNDPARYLETLKRHQFAMIALFVKMVQELAWGADADDELVRELSKNWTGSWVKFNNNNYTRGEQKNTPDHVYDWAQPF